jgi:hypothetical protein
MKYLFAFAVLLAGVPALHAQDRSSDREFRWEGTIPDGRWLYVRNLNGAIHVEHTSGSRAEVTAVKRWRRGNPEDVRIETSHAGSGDRDVVICALWYDNTQCDENGYRTRDNDRNRDRNNDVTVEFTVRLPEGVKLDVSTVNGGLDIDGASSQVEAHTVNGGVSATSTGGPVNAGTVNGDVEVRMGRLGDGDLEYSTVNGSIRIYVPDDLDADVDMHTVLGSVSSDFPMTLNGRISPRRVRATIGRGGRKMSFSTVTGSVELRKR